MSSSEEKSFATTAAFSAAFPILAGHLVAGLSELARLNLSMYSSVLADAQNRSESMPPSQTPEPLAWSPTGTFLPFAAQFAAHTSVMVDMTLQTSAGLNRLALDGYVETVRHATAAVAAMARSLRVADGMMKSASPAPEDSGCAVAAMARAALREIARKDVESVAGVAPTGRRQRSQSL